MASNVWSWIQTCLLFWRFLLFQRCITFMFSVFILDFLPFWCLSTLSEVFLTFCSFIFNSFGLIACFQCCIVMIETSLIYETSVKYWDFWTVLRHLYSTETFMWYWDFCAILKLLYSTETHVQYWDFFTALIILWYWDFCTVLRFLYSFESTIVPRATYGCWPCFDDGFLHLSPSTSKNPWVQMRGPQTP